VAAGDFRHIGIRFGKFRSLETVHQIAKACQMWAFLPIPGVVSPASALVGWGGRDQTTEWQNPRFARPSSNNLAQN
jgi:hypothetical protein